MPATANISHTGANLITRLRAAVSWTSLCAKLLAALFSTALLSQSAHADNVFVTSDTSVAGTVMDTNYIVGKDSGLNTLPGSVTLNVTGDVYPDTGDALSGPYGTMYGINVFGTSQAMVSGSTQFLSGYDNSVNTLAGGFAQNYDGYDSASLTINDGGTSNNTNGFINSVTTLSSGQINNWQSYQNAKLNVTGGTVGTAVLNGTSMVNLSGGTITNLTVNPGSVVNVSGSGTITNAPSGSGNVNYNNVTIPGTLTITGPITSLNNVVAPTVSVQFATVTLNNAPSVPAVNLVQVSNSGTLKLDTGSVTNLQVNDQSQLYVLTSPQLNRSPYRILR